LYLFAIHHFMMSKKAYRLFIALLLIVAVFLLVGGFYVAPRMLVSAGEKAMSRHNLETASAYFAYAQMLNPWRKDLYVKRGKIEFWQHNFNQALAYYEKAGPPQRDAKDYYYMLGAIHSVLQNYEKALEAFRKAGTPETRTTRELNALAATYLKLNDSQSAKTFATLALTKANEENDLFAKARANEGLGLAYAKEGHYETAENLIKSAISLWPENPFPHNSLGRVYELWGRNQEAIAAYEKSLEIAINVFNPPNPHLLRFQTKTAEALTRLKNQ
jgi:tetratricopeptide (TPR) repeat protein